MAGPNPGNGSRRYEVHVSHVIAEVVRRLQRKATRLGQGKEVASAFHSIVQQLKDGADRVGEPFYRLPSLRMQVQTVVVRPLSVDFGVCEDRPLVFNNRVRLLSVSH